MNLLVVPTRLDALIVTADMAVCQPHADFSRLPYRRGGVPFNAGHVNLAQSVVTQPFEDQGLWLRPGLHLSWSLPQALLRGTPGNGDESFAQLPNRWLVLRTGPNAAIAGWIVESDYVWPEGEGSAATQVSMPWVPDPRRGESQPFRFVGRTVPLDDWAEDPHAQRLPSLSAPGYGIADFLSFYPNSFSLFGLFDPAAADPAHALDQSRYQLIGWYGDRSVDPVALAAAAADAESPPAAAVAARFGWTLPADYAGPAPQGLLVYASLTLDTQAGLQSSVPPATALEVTVANTATQALAAHLAGRLDPEHATILEDQLDAFAMNHTGTAGDVDEFAAARLRQGFVARGHGTIWELAGSGDAAPPPELSRALAALNPLQAAYDDACAELDGRRGDLFADWHKYLTAQCPPDQQVQNYPDPDQIAFFIDTCDLAPLRRLEAQTGSLTLDTGPANEYRSARAQGAPDSTAARLAAALAALAASLTAPANAGWSLRRRAAHSYLAPAEPSLLLTGDAVEPVGSALAAPADPAVCAIAACDAPPLAGAAASAFLTQTVALLPTALTAAADYRWSAQPWRPVALEWQVQVRPFNDGRVDPIVAGRFSPSYLTGNFALGEDGDLLPKPGATLADGEGAMLAGRAVLGAYAPALLAKRLTSHLTQAVLPHYFAATQAPAATRAGFDLSRRLHAVAAWFEQTHGIAALPPAQQAANLEWTALRTLARIGSVTALSQRLTGYNAALLGQQHTLQLAVADPMGLSINAAFTREVAARVGNRNRLAPQPHNTFLPLRAGVMEIMRLRLVDRFGQSVERVRPNAAPAAALSRRMQSDPAPVRSTPQRDEIYLPPRLPQASRLQSNWLDARSEAPLFDGASADSPICGWIVPNFLDGSLLMFDPAGAPLGALTADPAQPWQTVPAAPQNTSPRSVPTPGMRRLASALAAWQRAGTAGRPGYLDGLLEVFEQSAALPAPQASVSSLPLMIGRPLALVRLRLAWQLDGTMAHDPGWNAFRLELQTRQRSTRGIEAVTLPVTLGDASRATNGIVGYWIETADGYLDDTFHAPLHAATPAARDPRIRVPAEGETSMLPLSLGGGALTLTAVIDPRAPVYVRSGLLPEQALQLSPALYGPLMDAFAVTFFTGPIITPQAQLRLTLPACPGAQWAWYAIEAGQYRAETPAPFAPNATYPGQRVVREGWAQLTP